MNIYEHEDRKRGINQIIFLHFTIFVLALSFVASKSASMYMSSLGLFSWQCAGSLVLYLLLTVIYAVTWQHNLEVFDLSFLYTNRSLYMIWSQIFAVVIFRDTIYLNNIIGLFLIFIGVWVNSKDA